ncbi:hypothetical protein [Actinomycetospora straminea]|uniref:hypothetical protein n=1 Tax=Actinomycetospora straminea TaxID=663607 RepID=UPI0031E4EEF8
MTIDRTAPCGPPPARSGSSAALVVPVPVVPDVPALVPSLGGLLLERVVEQALQTRDAPVGATTVEHDRFVGDTCFGE